MSTTAPTTIDQPPGGPPQPPPDDWVPGNEELTFVPAVGWNLEDGVLLDEEGIVPATLLDQVLDQGRFMLNCAGMGDLVVSSYGAIHALDLARGQTCVVDTGHMVGCDEGVSYEVQKAGNWKSTMLGAEGLVPKLPTQRS